MVNKKAMQWAMLCHIGGLAVFLLPFGNILVPLVIWLLKRRSDPFVDEQGKEALNFQISVLIAGLIAGLLCYVLVGFILLPVILIGDIILCIKATLRADKGEPYRYPFTLRFIK